MMAGSCVMRSSSGMVVSLRSRRAFRISRLEQFRGGLGKGEVKCSPTLQNPQGWAARSV